MGGLQGTLNIPQPPPAIAIPNGLGVGRSEGVIDGRLRRAGPFSAPGSASAPAQGFDGANAGQVGSITPGSGQRRPYAQALISFPELFMTERSAFAPPCDARLWITNAVSTV